MTIGDRVRAERTKLGKTQREFDAFVGLSRGHTGLIEKRGSASDRTCRRIAKKLRVPVAYLVYGAPMRSEST